MVSPTCFTVAKLRIPYLPPTRSNLFTLSGGGPQETLDCGISRLVVSRPATNNSASRVALFKIDETKALGINSIQQRLATARFTGSRLMNSVQIRSTFLDDALGLDL